MNRCKQTIRAFAHTAGLKQLVLLLGAVFAVLILFRGFNVQAAVRQEADEGHEEYAVLQNDGQLIFFESPNSYENYATGDFVDIKGNTYKGMVKKIDDWYQSWQLQEQSGIYVTGFRVAEGQSIHNLTEMNHLFAELSKMESFDARGLDTSAATTMSSMFQYCESLKSLDLSGFDTSKVTGMNSMFYGCNNLEELDISGFNTAAVTDMGRMFFGCRKLKQLDLSHFDTAAVTDMESMFLNCNSVTEINVSGWNTAAVKDMSSMFMYCESLQEVDLSGFNTAAVTNMRDMFWMAGVKSLDLSSFDTSKVTDMSYMFYFCPELKELDLSSFDTSSVTEMAEMFKWCDALSTIKLGKGFTVWHEDALLPEQTKWTNGNVTKSEIELAAEYPAHAAQWAGTWNRVQQYAVLQDNGEVVFFESLNEYEDYATGEVTDIKGNRYEGVTMLVRDAGFGFLVKYLEEKAEVAVKSIRVAEGQTISNLNSIDDFFRDLNSLERFDGRGFDTSSVKAMCQLFRDCKNLKEADLSSFDTSKVHDMDSMFCGCSSLTSLDLSGFDTSSVKTMSQMFLDCSSLNELDLSSFDTSSVKEMRSMFNGCRALSKLNVSSFDTSSVTNMAEMFYECENAEDINVSSFDTSSVTDMSGMFGRCWKLKTLDLSKFNTSSVTKMDNMFATCSALKALDLSSFDTSSVTSMYNMFGGCSNLEELDVSSFVTAGVTDMGWLFNNLSSLKKIKLGPGFTVWAEDALLPTDRKWTHGTMMLEAEELQREYPSHAAEWAGVWEAYIITPYAVIQNDGELIYCLSDRTYESGKTDEVEDLAGNHYTGLVFRAKDVWRWSEIENYFGVTIKSVRAAVGQTISCGDAGIGYFAFADLKSLESFDASGFDATNLYNAVYMFSGCTALKSLDLSSFRNTNLYYASNMFDGCTELTELDVSGLSFWFNCDMTAMFGYHTDTGENTCPNLRSVKLGPGFARWPESAQLPPNGVWTNGEISLSAEELCKQYPSHAEEWAGTWRIEGSFELPFVDVPEDKYFYEPVVWAYTHEPQITKGVDDTHFGPNITCTRGQVVTFLWRAKGCPEPKSTNNPFTDVKKNAFYYKAVLWAVENKITTGTSATTFSPNDPCTRGHVVTFMYRANGSPEISSANPFTDVKSNAFYYKAVLWAVENKITTGTSKTTFSPSDSCSRGQIVTFLYRNR